MHTEYSAREGFFKGWMPSGRRVDSCIPGNKVPYLFHYPHTIFLPVVMSGYDSISQASGELPQFTLNIKSVLRFESPVGEDFYTICAKAIFLV